MDQKLVICYRNLKPVFYMSPSTFIITMNMDGSATIFMSRFAKEDSVVAVEYELKGNPYVEQSDDLIILHTQEIIHIFLKNDSLHAQDQ